ncbi:unnamed protein product [Soboliphyme baturini]|uniref:Glycine-rich protein n=1 Tax=Soboliphyme baturini TaxID=241478 RepID=A0A183IZ48_9BILA|nr:unnamed protein product [Soboliphyme baturini]
MFTVSVVVMAVAASAHTGKTDQRPSTSGTDFTGLYSGLQTVDERIVRQPRQFEEVEPAARKVPRGDYDYESRQRPTGRGRNARRRRPLGHGHVQDSLTSDYENIDSIPYRGGPVGRGSDRESGRGLLGRGGLGRGGLGRGRLGDGTLDEERQGGGLGRGGALGRLLNLFGVGGGRGGKGGGGIGGLLNLLGLFG